jgi:hypothetical protein
MILAIGNQDCAIVINNEVFGAIEGSEFGIAVIAAISFRTSTHHGVYFSIVVDDT